MHKTKIVRIIFLILTILTAAAIFMFSSEDGKKSGETSRGVVKTVIDILPNTKNLDEGQKQEVIENSQPIIRKLAHFSIYTLLGLNVMGFLSTYNNINTKKQIILALTICIVYAISDEIHQHFSANRTPKILDVGIDTCGSILGVLIVQICSKIKMNILEDK